MVMAMTRHGRLMIAVLNGGAPTDDEWNRWIELGKPRLGADIRCVIDVYESPGPNARQRQLLTPWKDKVDMRTAVLSDSIIARGVVTAVSWLGIQNKAFVPGDVEGAARYLGLSPAEHAIASDQLAMLRKAAGVRRAPARFSMRSGPPEH